MSEIILVPRDKSGLHEASSYSAANDQVLLKKWYRNFDLQCGCIPEGVMMHIRHRQDTDLFYLADNPTSERHSNSCDLHTIRVSVSTEELQLLKPVVEFHPYIQRIRSEGRSNGAETVSKRTVMSGLEKLFATLITNAFVNYQFGRYLDLQAFVKKVIGNEKNKAIITPWGRNLTELCYYGPKGLEFAQSTVKRLEQTNNLIPATLWFNYAPAGTSYTGTSVTVGDNRFSANKVHAPRKASGPYLMFCTIAKEQTENQFREILLIPIVSKDYLFAVHSDTEREILQSFLPHLFGMNNSSDFSYYLTKPAWPVIDEGKVYWPDLLIYRKSKADKRKSFKVITNENADALAEIYGTEVLTMSCLLPDSEITW